MKQLIIKIVPREPKVQLPSTWALKITMTKMTDIFKYLIIHFVFFNFNFFNQSVNLRIIAALIWNYEQLFAFVKM